VAGLWESGCLGVHVLAAGRDSRLRLEAYYPGGLAKRILSGRLRRALARIEGGARLRFHLKSVGAGRWVERWQRTLRPMAIGGFLVVPEGCRVSTRGGRTLRVRFGQAFGTGEHATTRLCLRLLTKHLETGKTVADLGTGSAILAMAACRLGASRVVAVDDDEVALRVARANLKDNGLSTRIALLRADAGEIRRLAPFDLILVNIGAETIGRVLPSVAAALAPGGRAVLTGLLVEDEPFLLKTARRHRLVLVERRRSRPWSALVLRRPTRRPRSES